MSDMILSDYTTLSLLSRFDIKLGFAEQNIAEVCRRFGVDVNMFLLICNIHSYDNFIPDDKEIATINICSVIKYLQRSHTYYIEHRLLSLEQKMSSISNSFSDTYQEILTPFFIQYKQEVINHFNHEERVLFPYITALEKGNPASKFKSRQYEQNHSNMNEKLTDLINIIIKYLPEEYANEARNSILYDIFMLEADLTKHTRIENKILIPYVKNIEYCYE